MPAFFDTNVLVYCTDAAAPAKQSRARSLVAGSAAAGEAVVSTQVVEAATRAEAQTLYSEGLSHGQRFGLLTVVNPFLP